MLYPSITISVFQQITFNYTTGLYNTKGATNYTLRRKPINNTKKQYYCTNGEQQTKNMSQKLTIYYQDKNCPSKITHAHW
jgi:hypothetical protein